MERRDGVGLRYACGPWDTTRLRVFLNGEDVTSRCYTADDREGWLLRAVYSDPVAKTGYRAHPTKRGYVEYEVVHGDVRIVEVDA